MSFVYDSTPPHTSVSTANNSTYTGNSITISGGASDTAPGVLVRVEVSSNGGSSWTTVSGNTVPNWTHTFTNGTDGSYSLQFRAVDKAGDVDACQRRSPSFMSRRTRFRRRRPWNTSGAHVRTMPFSVSGTATDTAPGTVARVEVSSDGSTWSTVSGNTAPNWTHAFTATTDGAYTLRFRAVDSAGNVDPTPQQ